MQLAERTTWDTLVLLHSSAKRLYETHKWPTSRDCVVKQCESYMTWQIWVHEKNWLWWFLGGVMHFITWGGWACSKGQLFVIPLFCLHVFAFSGGMTGYVVSIWYCVCLSFTKNKIGKFEVINGMIFLNFLIRKNIIYLVLWRI